MSVRREGVRSGWTEGGFCEVGGDLFRVCEASLGGVDECGSVVQRVLSLAQDVAQFLWGFCSIYLVAVEVGARFPACSPVDSGIFFPGCS